MNVGPIKSLNGHGDLIITVNVKFARQFYARLWLAKQVLRFAAFILNCGVKVEETE